MEGLAGPEASMISVFQAQAGERGLGSQNRVPLSGPCSGMARELGPESQGPWA